MTPSTRMLSDCVQIKRRFLRSVNLEKDYQTDGQNGDYIVTPTSRQILGRLAEGLSEGSTYRAWTITGPYGVGKSAFAVFLTRVLCHQVEGSASARRHLEDTDQGLARQLSDRVGDGKGMLPVIITARRAPAALCLTEGIRLSLAQLKTGSRKPIVAECDSLLCDIRKGAVTDSRRIVSLTESLAAAAQGSGCSGLLFMIDELGKLFEFAARAPQNADLFVLQELAEQTSRSGTYPSLFLGFLHQSFEEYGQHLDSLTRREWAKIQGRFEDVAFLEPADQVVRMVAAAIERTGNPLSPHLAKQVRNVAKSCAENGACPPGMKTGEFEDICLRTYPLHPMTLAALPFVFRRFAQNERSLFSYLNSLEPSGFQDFLRTHSVTSDAPSFLRLSHLFDYFTVNFGGGLFRQPQARRWLEAADVMDRKENLTLVHHELIKTIGILGALGEFSHLRSTESMIALSVGDGTNIPSEVEAGIRSLQEQSILTHRRFNSTYSIWEGSDVDIDERVSEGERQLYGRISLASSIKQYLPPRPMVARRHSFLTGSLRYFAVTYLDDPAKVPVNPLPATGAAGQVLVLVSSSPSSLQAFRDIATSARPERRDVVYAIPQQIGEIQSVVAELAALRWAWDNTPELRDDRVARREVSLRITEAEDSLRRRLDTLLDPRKEPMGSECLWYWNGELQPVRTRANVSNLLSSICDDVYSETPWIRNELIARRTLSSAALAGRRNLIERMLTSSALPALGIEGSPPERSMYESLLRSAGLHREVNPGEWGFGDPPEQKDHGLMPVWRRLHEIIFRSDSQPIPLDALFRMLSDPPYGLVDGLHPVLLCAFVMAYSDESTLYRQGTFIPEPAISDFEVLTHRPELYGIAGSRTRGTRAAVVRRLAEGLRVNPATVPVVRALFQEVRRLPEFSWRTKRLTEETIRLREAFEKAKSPEKFLYFDMPVAFGLPPFPESEIEQSDVEAFFVSLNKALKEWTGIASTIHAEARAELLRACGFQATDDGWQRLREIAAKLESRENDPLLQQFLRRAMQSGSDENGISSVLALVAGRPLTNWADSDVDRCPELAKAMGDLFRRAMSRAGIAGSTSQSAMDALTHDQQQRARSLARELEKRLDTSKQRTTPGIMRAALMLLADELVEEGECKK